MAEHDLEVEGTGVLAVKTDTRFNSAHAVEKWMVCHHEKYGEASAPAYQVTSPLECAIVPYTEGRRSQTWGIGLSI